MKMEPICSTETSVINYLYSLRNDTEERSSSKIFFSPIDSGAYRAPLFCTNSEILPRDKAADPVANRSPRSSAGIYDLQG